MLLVLPPLLFLNEFVWYAIVAFAFSASRPRSAYLSTKHWIDRAAGAVVGALGLKLMLEGMAAILTPEQYELYSKQEEARAALWREGGGGGGFGGPGRGPGGPPPR